MDNFFNAELNDLIPVNDDTIIKSYKKGDLYTSLMRDELIEIDNLKTILKLISLHSILNHDINIILSKLRSNVKCVGDLENSFNVSYCKNFDEYKEIIDYIISSFPKTITNMDNINNISSKLNYFDVDNMIVNKALQDLVTLKQEFDQDYLCKLYNKVTTEDINARSKQILGNMNIQNYMSPNTFLVGNIVKYIVGGLNSEPKISQIVICQDDLYIFLSKVSELIKYIPHDKCNYINKVNFIIPKKYLENLNIVETDQKENIKEQIYKVYIEYKCKINQILRDKNKKTTNNIINMCYKFCTFEDFNYEINGEEPEINEECAIVLKKNSKYIVISQSTIDIMSYLRKYKSGSEHCYMTNQKLFFTIPAIINLRMGKNDIIPEKISYILPPN